MISSVDFPSKLDSDIHSSLLSPWRNHRFAYYLSFICLFISSSLAYNASRSNIFLQGNWSISFREVTGNNTGQGFNWSSGLSGFTRAWSLAGHIYITGGWGHLSSFFITLRAFSSFISRHRYTKALQSVPLILSRENARTTHKILFFGWPMKNHPSLVPLFVLCFVFLPLSY